MKKLTATVTVRVLGTSRNDKAEKANDPPFLVNFEWSNSRSIQGSDEVFEEKTVERFKSFCDVPKGMQTLRVELGAYVNGTQAALYGRILEILPSVMATTAAKKAADGGKA